MIAERRLLAKKLKEARKTSQMKQEQVARILGLPVSAVSAMEAGKRKVEAPELFVLASLYQMPMEWFFSHHPELDGRLMGEKPSLVEEEVMERVLLAECLRLLACAPIAQREKVLIGWIAQLKAGFEVSV